MKDMNNYVNMALLIMTKRNKEYFYKKYSLFLNGLYKIKQGDKVRIWISQVPMEMWVSLLYVIF